MSPRWLLGMLGTAVCAAALACGGGEAPRHSAGSTVTILYDDPGDEFWWHDGVPVTAHDVKFTMDLWAHPDVLYPGGSGSATVLDDSTLRITYRRPSRRERDGAQLSVKLLISTEDEAEAIFVQDALRRVGARVEIHRMDLNLVRRRIRAGEFDATIRTFYDELGGNFGQLKMFGPGSPIGYRNPRAWALLEAARQTVHPDSLDAIYTDLMPIFQADLPMTFLHRGVFHVAARRHVTGLSSPYRAEPTVWMAELALDNKR